MWKKKERKEEKKEKKMGNQSVVLIDVLSRRVRNECQSKDLAEYPVKECTQAALVIHTDEELC